MISNPIKTRAIAEAKIKTEQIDARILAQLLAAGFLPEVWRPSEELQALRRLVAPRTRIVRERIRLKNQVQAVLHRNLVPRCPAADLFGQKGRVWLTGRGRERGLLARVPALAAGPRPHRGAPVRLRRPPGAQERDRRRARAPLAARHRALPARHARPLRRGPPADDRDGHPPGLQRRLRAEARERLGTVAERLADHAPEVAELLLGAEEDLLGFSALPKEHWTKLRSTNPLERVNREIGRRSRCRRPLPATPRSCPASGLLVEINDEWLVAHRYISLGSIAQLENDKDGPGGPVAAGPPAVEGALAGTGKPTT